MAKKKKIKYRYECPYCHYEEYVEEDEGIPPMAPSHYHKGDSPERPLIGVPMLPDDAVFMPIRIKSDHGGDK